MSSSHAPARIGVIGIGNFGRMHARTLAGLAEAELVGVIDSSAASVEQLRRSLPDVRVWPDLDAALAESGAEAWVIATRTESHVPLAERILSRGLTVLIEKPLAAELATAQRLAPLVAADSSNLMMGHIVLFSSTYRRLMAEAQNRGGIRYFHAVRHRPQLLTEIFPEETPLRLTMVHDLYMAMALMNGQEPTHLSGRMRPLPGGRQFDLAQAELHWPNGTWGSFTASFLTPPGMPADGFDRFEIFGDGWAARADLNPQPLQVFTDKAEWPVGLEINDDPAAPAGFLAEELRHFCRVVTKRAAVPLGCRFEDALRLQRWIEQLEADARRQQQESNE